MVVKKDESLKNYLNKLSIDFFDKCSLILLSIWVLYPLVMMILNTFNEKEFSGISMHSADYYPQQNCIVIFGGFKGESLNKMYFYKIETNEFIEIKYKNNDKIENIKNKEENEENKLDNENNINIPLERTSHSSCILNKES